MGRGILEVHLVDAKGLADTDFLGKIDPYVLIQYRSQEHKSSIARGQGRNPSWNETFKFQVNSQGSNIQHKLTLRVMDHDTFSRDDFIGEATSTRHHRRHHASERSHHLRVRLRTSNLIHRSPIIIAVQAQFTLSGGCDSGGVLQQHPTKYSVVLPDRSYCGEIRVGINFKAKVCLLVGLNRCGNHFIPYYDLRIILRCKRRKNKSSEGGNIAFVRENRLEIARNSPT